MTIRESNARTEVSRGLAVGAGLVVALLALGLRCPQIRDSLWLDELHTAWCVSGSWSDVAPRATFGNQSPCYFLLLRAVVGVCGFSELSLRLPSLLAGLGLVAVCGVAISRWTGSLAAGCFAAVLLALDRNGIFYSQEARPYAVLQLVAWCHALVVWKLSQNANGLHRALFVVGAIAQFYLHYTAALFLIAEIVFLLDSMYRQDRPGSYRLSQLALDLGLVVIAALPTARHLIEIGSRRGMWEQFVRIPEPYDFWHALRLEVYLLPSLGLFLAWRLLYRGSQGIARTGDGQRSESVSLVASLLFVPPVLAWFATRRHLAALFLGRYLVSSLTAAPLAAALVSRLIPAPWLRCVAVSTTIVASVWSSGMWQQWRYDGRILGDRRQDWRGAVEFVNQHTDSSNEAVAYVRSGFIEAAGLQAAHVSMLEDYCLAPVNSLYRLRIRAIPLSSGPTIPIDPTWVQAEAPVARWFLLNGSRTTRERLLAEIERQCAELGLPAGFAEKQEFGDVVVCKLAPFAVDNDRSGSDKSAAGR